MGPWENAKYGRTQKQVGSPPPVKNSVLSDSLNVFLFRGTCLRKRFPKKLLCLPLFICFLQNPVFNLTVLGPLSYVFRLLHSTELHRHTPEGGHVCVFRGLGLAS